MFTLLTCLYRICVLSVHSVDTSIQELCQCLNVPSGADPVDKCLSADNLTDIATPYDITDDVMTALLQWWGHVITAAGPDPSFKGHYLSVVAR